MHGLLQKLKRRLLPAGTAPRCVPLGLFRGLRLNLDLRDQAQVYFGIWEREVYTATRHLLKGCQSAVDVGACAGEYTLLCLRQPSMRRVIAVEPYPPNLDRLHANLELNHLRDDPRLDIRTEFLGHSSKPGTTTLDDLGIPEGTPLFIKIDVDGGELDVLRGGPKLLARSNVSLLVETHSVELEKTCIEFLAAAGYDCRIIPNAWWRRFIPEDRPIGQNRWFAAIRPRGAA